MVFWKEFGIWTFFIKGMFQPKQMQHPAMEQGKKEIKVSKKIETLFNNVLMLDKFLYKTFKESVV